MPQLNIKCGCETAPEIEITVHRGVVPIAVISCQKCEFTYTSIGGEVCNA